MLRIKWIAGAASFAIIGALGGSLASSFASAQDAPESLLPPGFDDPAPTPAPAPAARPTAAPAPASPGTAPNTAPNTAPGAAPDGGQPGASLQGDLPPGPQVSDRELDGLPSLDELERLSTDQLDILLGLKPKFDIPPAARRSLAQVGILAPSEGGLPARSLAQQPQSVVRAVLAGTRGPLVSRWGHILVRRALVSRLAAPQGMSPVEFAALRAGVLNSMGEFAAARAIAQDIDTSNWNRALTSQALTAYIAASDLIGACPAVRLQGAEREDPQWVMLQAICNAYAGEEALGGSQLDRALANEIAPDIDILLAQRFAGAAGRARRGVTIEWTGVEELTPWRFAIANAVGEPVPDELLETALEQQGGAYYQLAASSAPMLPLADRARHAAFAASAGVLSASAMVDLYSQIYTEEAIAGDTARRAADLREAYVGTAPATRIDAIRRLWNAFEGQDGFAARILTAYAAARIPPASEYGDAAGELIASMLNAGLDRDAAAWSDVVEEGSAGWALIALANAQGGAVNPGAVEEFFGNDDSEDARKSAFLVAGLAGLGRLSDGDFQSLSNDLDVDFSRQTRWTRLIDRAAELENLPMVALLAGLGMQGTSWSQMTPLHLYHITSSLRRVGLEAEARMIAAEAVARG